MPEYKLKVRIGEHEFEAEGPIEVVQSQFLAFKELVAAIPMTGTVQKQVATAQPASDNVTSADSSAVPLEKITRVEDRVVSLTARPETVEDALLVLLLGQRTFRGSDSVTGSEVINGLRQSGFTVGRVDWRLDKLAANGLIIKIGSGRASRYRLTNQGMNKAQGVAKALISLVP